MNHTDIAGIRTDYRQHRLSEEMAGPDPLFFFRQWFEEAIKSQVNEPNAMCLSTATPEGKPAARIVLLKGVDQTGFVFFTNYHSRKGQMLEANPQAALTFFWPELERQVRVEGKVEKVSEQEADAYFLSRPFQSQLGAWASDQSVVIPNREFLEEKYRKTEENFSQNQMFRPPHWGGYRLVPDLLEFWQGRASRLHDRIQYTLDNTTANWKIDRLSP